MKYTLYKEIAQQIFRIHRNSNLEIIADAERKIAALNRELPSGAGINNGSKVDVDNSTPEKIIILTSFHHMDENGSYDGWTEHKVTVTPSFIGEIDVEISGRNKNDIREYLADVFHDTLTAEVEIP